MKSQTRVSGLRLSKLAACHRTGLLATPPKLLSGADVSPGVVVVDVGIHRVDGRLIGDVDQESVEEFASFLTPVPGGVGPMTIATLLANTLRAAELQEERA